MIFQPQLILDSAFFNDELNFLKVIIVYFVVFYYFSVITCELWNSSDDNDIYLIFFVPIGSLKHDNSMIETISVSIFAQHSSFNLKLIFKMKEINSSRFMELDYDKKIDGRVRNTIILK